MSVTAREGVRSTDKRERILEAAERAFAQEGYHATTMRHIADMAGERLSLIVYHFETKLRLYREIFVRRQYLNDARLGLLDEIDLAADDAIPRIVDAFADPILQLHDRPEDLWFARLVLREAADPSSNERGIVHEFFDPLAQRFIDAIARANPGRDPDFYRWSYLFAVGALTSSSNDARVSDLGGVTPGVAGAGAVSPRARLLKEFIAKGWSSQG